MSAIDWMSDQVATQLGVYQAELAALDAEMAARRQPLLDRIAELQEATDLLATASAAVTSAAVTRGVVA